MTITRINFTGTVADEQYLAISDHEIREMHEKIVQAYNTSLSTYGVKTLWKDTIEDCTDLSDRQVVMELDAKELQLIFLYKYIGCFVHKDLVSIFVRRHIPTAALDQQVRHLGAQYHWYVLNKGAIVPDTGEKVPSGFNYLVSIETPNPKVVAAALKRAGRVSATNFEELKIAYGQKCATCGIEEGKKDSRTNAIVVLQQGHMDPRKPLELTNTIPQCQYCNQTYQDYFRFNEHGRVVAVNNPEILLRSPRDIRDEMIEVLLEEREREREREDED